MHALAEHCGYGTLKVELNWDRIVVFMADEKCSEKLHLADADIHTKSNIWRQENGSQETEVIMSKKFGVSPSSTR